jgi:hypothetical protein
MVACFVAIEVTRLALFQKLAVFEKEAENDDDAQLDEALEPPPFKANDAVRAYDEERDDVATLAVPAVAANPEYRE